METNRTLRVEYKVDYQDDRKLLCDSFEKIIKAHLDYCIKHKPDIPAKAFVVFDEIGIVRWETEY